MMQRTVSYFVTTQSNGRLGRRLGEESDEKEETQRGKVEERETVEREGTTEKTRTRN